MQRLLRPAARRLGTTPLFECDAVVIGGGVVGLAAARALALAGRDVTLLEAAGATGTGNSSRSSEGASADVTRLEAAAR